MTEININFTKFWQNKYKLIDYDPKSIFVEIKSKKNVLFAISFFLMIMSVEILFNQPFKKRINLFHNNFFRKVFKKKIEKLERIQINSFAYSLFLMCQKLFEEDERLKKYAKEIILYTFYHWSSAENLNNYNHKIYLNKINSLWDINKNLILSRTYDSRIDLIFLLYKSFELGVADKKIIKKNLSVLIFSVSKAQKEFRYDVLKELKKKKFL